MNRTFRLALYVLVLTVAAALVYRLVVHESDQESEPRSTKPTSTTEDEQPSAETVPHHLRQNAERPLQTPSDETPSITLSGNVIDGTNRGVADVALRFTTPTGTSVHAISQSDGSYQLALPSGEYRVELRSHEVVVLEQTLVIDGEGTVPNIPFQLDRPSQLNGTVLDATGKPLQGITVTAWPIDDALSSETARDPAARTLTRRDGQFSFWVPAKPLRIVVDAGAKGLAVSMPIYVPSNSALSGLVMKLGSGVTLTGQIVGPRKESVENAFVLISEIGQARRIPCDKDGTFSVGNLLPGKRLMQAFAPGYSPSRLTELVLSPSGINQARIELTSQRRLTGHVTDIEGNALNGVELHLSTSFRDTHQTLLQPLKTISDAQGAFHFEAVPDVPLTLFAFERHGLIAKRHHINADNPVTLRLEPSGGIVGQITEGEEAQPLSDAMLTLYDDTQTIPIKTMRAIHSQGRFQLARLIPGTYRLAIAAPEYAASIHPQLSVVAGGNASADTALYRGGSLSGTVLDGRNVAIAGARIALTVNAHSISTISRADGTFSLNNLPRGVHVVTVTHPSYLEAVSMEISIFPGQVTSVTPRLQYQPQSLEAARLGIGLSLARNGFNKIVVVKIAKLSPSAYSDIRVDDELLSIDDRLTDRTVPHLMEQQLFGLQGTSVNLKLAREGRVFSRNVIRAP